MRITSDPGLPSQKKDFVDLQQPFMPFGVPHVLTILAEVLNRAIEAACFYKYNVHRWLRPEAVGRMIERYYANS